MPHRNLALMLSRARPRQTFWPASTMTFGSTAYRALLHLTSSTTTDSQAQGRRTIHAARSKLRQPFCLIRDETSKLKSWARLGLYGRRGINPVQNQFHFKLRDRYIYCKGELWIEMPSANVRGLMNVRALFTTRSACYCRRE